MKFALHFLDLQKAIVCVMLFLKRQSNNGAEKIEIFSAFALKRILLEKRNYDVFQFRLIRDLISIIIALVYSIFFLKKYRTTPKEFLHFSEKWQVVFPHFDIEMAFNPHIPRILCRFPQKYGE